MALEYFLYITQYNNTLVDRGDTSFTPTPPYGEIHIDFLIPQTQPLYLYRESGGTIVLNDDVTINAYLEGTADPPGMDDNVLQYEYTGYTATTDIRLEGTENDVTYISGVTDTKHNILDFNNFTGTTLPADYYDKTEINSYSATTDTIIGSKLNASDFNLYSGTTDVRLDGVDNDVVYLSGQTDTKINIIDFNSYSATTDTRLDSIDNDVVYLSGQTDIKLAITDFDTYSAATDTYIETKIDKVTGATGHLPIFLTNGNIEDSGVTIDSLTGGTGYYYYIDLTGNVTTTSPTTVVYLSGRSAILTAGTWSIDFNAIGGNTSPNKAIVVEFYIDSILQGYPIRFKTNDPAAVIAFVVSKDLTLTNDTHLFEIKFSAPIAGTAYIEYGSIRARIVK